MVSRLRLWDLLTVLGVLFLLFGVPASIAQDESEDRLAKGFSYVVPAPREGDRVVFDAWIVHEDEEPVVVGPVMEQTIRSVPRGEIPVEALYAREVRWLPVQESFGWGTYRIHEERDTRYFDADGRWVWYAAEEVFELADGSLERQLRWGRDESGGPGGLADWAGLDVHVVPSVGRAMTTYATANALRYVLEGMPDDFRDAMITTHAIEVNGHTLYEFGDGPEIQSEEQARIAYWGGTGFAGHGVELNEAAKRDGARFAQGHPFYSETVPLKAGGWSGVLGRNTNEPYLQVWLLPRSIERGVGPDLPIEPTPGRSIFESGPRPDHQEIVPTAHTSSLASIWSDPRPIAGGVRMQDLHDVVLAGSLDVERRPPAEARLLDVFWVDNGTAPLVLSEGTIPSVLPLPIGQEDGDLLTDARRSTWLTSWVDPADGSVEIIHLVLDASADGVEVVDADNVCLHHERVAWVEEVAHIDCHPVPVDRTAPDRQVVSPWDAEAHNLAAIEHATGAQTSARAGMFLSSTWPSQEDILVQARSTMRAWGYGGIEGYAYAPAGETVPFAEGGMKTWARADEDARTFTATLDLEQGHTTAVATTEQNVSKDVEDHPGLQRLTTSNDHVRVLGAVDATVLFGGAVLVLVGLLARLAAWISAGGAFPVVATLFSRIEGDRALQHKRREAIVAMIRAEPGMTTSDLARQTGWGWGTVVHHVETLERNGLLVHVQHGRRRCFFAPESASPLERRRSVCLADPADGPFLQAIEAKPGATLKELVAQVDQGTTGASRTGSRLERMGLVRKQREGRTVRYFPAGLQP